MGKTTTPRYVIKDERGQSFGAWETKSSPGRTGYGRPTVQNLMKWRDGFNLSLFPGGANEHLGQPAWIQRRIFIFDQYLNRRIVEYNPPLFETLPSTREAAREREKLGLFNKPNATTCQSKEFILLAC